METPKLDWVLESIIVGSDEVYTEDGIARLMDAKDELKALKEGEAERSNKLMLATIRGLALATKYALAYDRSNPDVGMGPTVSRMVRRVLKEFGIAEDDKIGEMVIDHVMKEGWA